MSSQVFRETQYGHVLAAVVAHLDRGESFTLADLIAAVWRTAPERFALAGHPELPDGHKVRCCVCGPRSLVARGYLERVGACRFRLTDCGREKARGVEIEPPTVTPRLHKLLVRAKGTAAYRLYDLGKQSEITFTDALAFWGANRRGAHLLLCILDLKALLEDRESDELRLLGACHDWLHARFQHQIRMSSRPGRATA